MQPTVYNPKHPVRFVTAASLFDGHDAAINIMRRILQASGAEVIHLGHNRSVQEIVETAIEEDVQGIAVSSYQGGHMEFFRYMHDLLRERGAGHIRIYGGGGGVIVPEEIRELQEYGIARIFSPEDGLDIGLQGMINLMLEECDFDLDAVRDGSSFGTREPRAVARQLTAVEAGLAVAEPADASGGDGALSVTLRPVPAIGITGTGGAGKSTLTDELVRRFLNDFRDLSVAVLSVDPTRRKTGGALLGDRIRMNAIFGEHADRVYMRSFATREANRATTKALRDALSVVRAAGFDLVIVETAGIGQSDTEIADLVDLPVYVMTQEYGAATQLEKIGMLDVAEFVALNKFEKRGSEDALREVRKTIQRNRGAFDVDPAGMPVYPTMASHFDDPGVTRLYLALLDRLNTDFAFGRASTVYDPGTVPEVTAQGQAVIPPSRQRYLGEIVDACRAYRSHAEAQVEIARRWGQAAGAREQVVRWSPADRAELEERIGEMERHW